MWCEYQLKRFLEDGYDHTNETYLLSYLKYGNSRLYTISEYAAHIQSKSLILQEGPG